MDQYEVAKKAMIDWLSFPGELGKEPELIECTKKFTYDNLAFYIFKFKKNDSDEKWILGVNGGYEENSEESGGQPFSDGKEYVKETEEEDAVKIIEMIRHYWKVRAQEIIEKEIEKIKQE
jgi:hypothetical protein